jgi:N-acetylmuramic acid 6-phosphate etherase
MTHSLLLGVDGGGSRTRALIADAEGRLLGSGASGSSNLRAAGFAAAAGALRAAVEAAFARAGTTGPVAAACFGLAGAGREDEQAQIRAWLAAQGFARRVQVVPDAALALAAGTPDGWGVALICGTGSIGYGRAPDGRVARAGGWGYLLGDEGSGYDLAQRGLRLATQTADGRAAAAGVLRAALDHWGVPEPAGLIARVYAPDVTRARIADFARVIVALAEAGDPNARGLLHEAAGELARLALAPARALGLRRPPVALAGGLLMASPRLRAELAAALGGVAGPLATVEEPAQGALVLARRLLASDRDSG